MAPEKDKSGLTLEDSEWIRTVIAEMVKQHSSNCGFGKKLAGYKMFIYGLLVGLGVLFSNNIPAIIKTISGVL